MNITINNEQLKNIERMINEIIQQTNNEEIQAKAYNILSEIYSED